MQNLDNLISLAVAAATGKNIPTEYSVGDVNDTLRAELAEFKDYAYYRENKNSLFRLIESAANIIMPAKVIARFGNFAEVKQVPYGDKLVFTQRTGVTRGKKFATVAGEHGTYRTFTLDTRSLALAPRVYAGGVHLELVDFLTGRISMAELMNIIIEAVTEKLYFEIQNILKASITATNRPEANKAVMSGFQPAVFDEVIDTVAAYGDSVNIYCTRKFASTLFNSPSWADASKLTSNQDYEDIRNSGFVGKYKGADVVILEQSFADEANAVKLVDDQFAYIMPSGKEKPVKVGIEGGAIMRDAEYVDGTLEFTIQSMFDVGVISNNYWGIVQNTGL